MDPREGWWDRPERTRRWWVGTMPVDHCIPSLLLSRIAAPILWRGRHHRFSLPLDGRDFKNWQNVNSPWDAAYQTTRLRG